VCVTLLNPLNGFWFGLGLCLVLFIPGIVFSVKLINLYRKTEKYSPDYEEPDYISYHGFYMRPASDDGETRSRRKHRLRKGKSDQINAKGDSSAYGFSHRHGPTNSSYQPVSVYPYDAYE
uniref:Vesicular, overexpressed in cancer, prosurvival protein 1 n=1 Tax=Mesocestoides corti TaxID=53468 RepID=A0A5K3FKP6_MESCO